MQKANLIPDYAYSCNAVRKFDVSITCKYYIFLNICVFFACIKRSLHNCYYTLLRTGWLFQFKKTGLDRLHRVSFELVCYADNY